jgi:phage terminase small subunit
MSSTPVIRSTSLTLRRQKFVSEYVETGNATQAARLAGYSRSGARDADVLRT